MSNEIYLNGFNFLIFIGIICEDIPARSSPIVSLCYSLTAETIVVARLLNADIILSFLLAKRNEIGTDYFKNFMAFKSKICFSKVE